MNQCEHFSLLNSETRELRQSINLMCWGCVDFNFHRMGTWYWINFLTVINNKFKYLQHTVQSSNKRKRLKTASLLKGRYSVPSYFFWKEKSAWSALQLSDIRWCVCMVNSIQWASADVRGGSETEENLNKTLSHTTASLFHCLSVWLLCEWKCLLCAFGWGNYLNTYFDYWSSEETHIVCM